MLDKIITSLTAEESATIEAMASAKLAERGRVLLEQGNDERDLYFLLSGEVTVYQLAVLAQQPCALEIGRLTAPLLLGEANLFRADKRAASILVSQEARYVHLPYAKIQDLQAQHPAIYTKLLIYAGAVVAQRLIDVQQNLQLKLVTEASDLHHALINLKKYFGGATPCSPDMAHKLFGIEQPI